ncbi:MAG TPA: hypothetical protein VFH35_06245 [Ramlibacter sp.]|nr:hypothetical protein [Ramlibacter sp.]
MAQRFGRNQRRRAREALAAMTRANTMNQGLLRKVSEDNETLRGILSEAREVLGNHPALPPKNIGNHPRPLGGDFDFPVPQPLDWRADSLTQPTRILVARMHEMLASVDVRNHADEIHCRVRLDSGDVVYCISGAALSSMRQSPEHLTRLLTREIAPRMGRLLSQVLCKGVR